MVCLACLLPLFLVPIVNILPILFYYIMGKVYALFGWEYRKPERAPPACPYKPKKEINGKFLFLTNEDEGVMQTSLDGQTLIYVGGALNLF